jgi:glycosyltransferase involved in cell wall biosynthesis
MNETSASRVLEGRPMPSVSVIMPVLNESRHLREAVLRILAQEYPGDIEVVIALGPSKDDTDAIAAALVAETAGTAREVRTVPNPSGRTPAGLNAAIRGSHHPVVVRVDGHGLLTPGYIATAVGLLDEMGAANVGGIMHAEGETDWEKAVAAAMTSKIGVGNASFHTGGAAAPADTVYLGVFRREVLEKQGGYNEEFVRAQDWELNYRIRQDGGLVWFTPDLRVTYRPRPTVRTLARQYHDYGRWRRVVTRYHRGSVNLRYLAPPTALLGVALGLIGGFLVHPLLFAAPVGYAAAILIGLLREGRGLPIRARLRIPIALTTMHMAWGWGFLTSPRSLARRVIASAVPAAGAVGDRTTSSHTPHPHSTSYPLGP